MATQDKDTTTTTQESQVQDGQGGGQDWSQPQFDQLFSQITSGQPEQAQMYVQAYFDLADQTLRTARKVSEVWAIGVMREQIVNEVSQRVLQGIAANPQLLQQFASAGRSSR